jgi:hypothetical protein
MRKIFKTILLVGCMVGFSASLATLTACQNTVDNRPTIEGITFAGEEEKTGPQFLEGALVEVQVNETIKLNEYIDYVEAPYTITVTDKDGNVTDLSEKTYWVPKTAGEYVLTYTVKSGAQKGTSTLVLNVRVPELTWEFNVQNIPYNYGETLNFNEYFGSMNIFTTLPNCTYIMDSVEVDGELTSLVGETEYTFASRSDHTFRFHAESPDGQTCEGREVISIKYIDEAYAQELSDMGISLYGDLYVERGNFTTIEGTYCNGNNVWLRRENGPHNLPYIAYNGDYGINSYVKLDFTGKNLPILSFFRDDDYSNSIFDGTKGIVYTGGFTNNQGKAIHKEMCSRGTLYGPYMVHEYDRGADDTTVIGSTGGDSSMPQAGSFNSLQDGVHYRMIAGFSDIRVGSANLLGTTTPVDTVFLTYECLIINLDTKEISAKFTIDSYGLNALGFDKIPVTAENNEFFTGNIVLYGNHGMRMVFDEIYPIITGQTFEEICAEELELSTFKEDAETFILSSGVTLKVSDYVDIISDDYLFFYRDEQGNTYPVEGDTFTIEEAGSYVLYYSDGEHLCATLPLTIADFSDELRNWILDSNVNFYGLNSLTEERALRLNAGTAFLGANYNGPNSGNVIDQAYFAFDGNYSYNDFIAFDFTGKNMPEVAFFAKNYNNSMYYQDGGKQGMVFMSGVTTNEGLIDQNILFGGTAVNVDSPFMVTNAYENWLMEGGSSTSMLARANLVDDTHYRVILGFTYAPVYKADGVSIDRTVPTMNWYLYNLDTNEVVERGSMATWNFFTGSNPKVNNLRADDLVGSIVLYGKFGTTLSIDKLYGIFEDTTLEDVANALNDERTFTATFIGLDGEVLKTITNIPVGENVSYGGEMPKPTRTEDSAFTYAYQWDKPLGAITQDMIYTLEVVATPKENVKTYNSYLTNTGIKLNSGWIGNGASYTLGQNNGGGVDQAYLAIDGEYGLDTYVAFDFTGKNLPEIAFFAKNYNNSMYAEGTSKQGIVVVTGITTWDGQLGSGVNGNGTKINYGFPYMIQNAADGGFCDGALAQSALGRANLVDGTRYRVIMGFTGSGNAITLHWYLYNLDTKTVVEQSSMTTWGFFTGSNEKVGNMTISDLVGSIVLYGKFGVDTQIDKFCGLYENSSIDAILEELGMK